MQIKQIQYIDKYLSNYSDNSDTFIYAANLVSDRQTLYIIYNFAIVSLRLRVRLGRKSAGCGCNCQFGHIAISLVSLQLIECLMFFYGVDIYLKLIRSHPKNNKQTKLGVKLHLYVELKKFIFY